MKRKMNNIKIVSTGKYIPQKTLTNADLEKMVETSDEWIYSRTGIKSRHVVTDETITDLAYLAAKNAIDKVNYDINKIDLIIVATCSSEYKTPSVANVVQAKLGLNDKDIPCFDITAACSGFVYALDVASQMINSGGFQGALVIGAETLSHYTDYSDRNTCILFGDGAGAMIIENTTEDKLAYFYTASMGDLDETLIVKDKIAMEGRKVYTFATRAMETSVNKVLNDCQLSKDDIDVIIPHQANIRIIETASKALDINMDKFYVNIEEYGNTSSASIIIALDEYLDKLESKQNQKIIFVAFGGGFTWGAALLTL